MAQPFATFEAQAPCFNQPDMKLGSVFYGSGQMSLSSGAPCAMAHNNLMSSASCDVFDKQASGIFNNAAALPPHPQQLTACPFPQQSEPMENDLDKIWDEIDLEQLMSADVAAEDGPLLPVLAPSTSCAPQAAPASETAVWANNPLFMNPLFMHMPSSMAMVPSQAMPTNSVPWPEIAFPPAPAALPQQQPAAAPAAELPRIPAPAAPAPLPKPPQQQVGLSICDPMKQQQEQADAQINQAATLSLLGLNGLFGIPFPVEAQHKQVRSRDSQVFNNASPRGHLSISPGSSPANTVSPFSTSPFSLDSICAPRGSTAGLVTAQSSPSNNNNLQPNASQALSQLLAHGLLSSESDMERKFGQHARCVSGPCANNFWQPCEEHRCSCCKTGRKAAAFEKQGHCGPCGKREVVTGLRFVRCGKCKAEMVEKAYEAHLKQYVVVMDHEQGRKVPIRCRDFVQTQPKEVLPCTKGKRCSKCSNMRPLSYFVNEESTCNWHNMQKPVNLPKVPKALPGVKSTDLTDLSLKLLKTSRDSNRSEYHECNDDEPPAKRHAPEPWSASHSSGASTRANSFSAAMSDMGLDISQS